PPARTAAPAPALAPAPAPALATAPPPEPPAPVIPASGPLQARVTRSGDGLRIGFPFAVRPPAALFERGGVATLAFESPLLIRLDADALPGGSAARLLDSSREGGFAVLRFALAGGALSQLVAGEGGGWDLVLGDGSAPGAVPLVPRRAADEAGKPAMAVPLPRPGGAFWLDRDGERIAVATALGPRTAGVAKRGRFVEFEILASRQGVAVLSGADDLVVRPGLDEVAITRPGGLAVSPVVADPLDAGAPVGAEAPAVDTARWREDRRGHGLARLHDAAVAAATAERAARPAARVDYARALMANGLHAEAASVLATAFKDDPILAADRRSRVLAAIAAVLLGRDARAAELLGTDVRGGQDPETRLWRAMLDARAGRGVAALAAFKAGLPLIETYPEDLQGPLLLAGARTALDGRDPAFAQKLLTLAGPLAETPLARDQVAFLRNRFAEEIGQDEAAMREYRRLSEEGERPVAAEAALRRVDLGLASGKLGRDEAIDRLERLVLTWHGAPLEPAALGRLGRLYAEAGRWRDAFAVARKANRFYPDDPATRDLHEATVALFAGLFLTDKGARLGKVEALALYFDFKEFTPIGRQGDEIVRRLADRLVALDLLDAAGDLLQHQVDKRLTGAARAAVAAKLATVRLMDGRPLQALQVLQATRLPELPPSVRDARLLLEARALSDLSRTDLALEKLDGVDGPEAGRLRADALWAARRWREAGEAHEALVATRWREPGPLRDDERADVLRAAIAYALAEEAISLDRLRTKFMSKMAESADARAFALLSTPNAAGTAAFRDLARRAITADTLSGFLASYRARYPESAAPARPSAPAPETPPPAAEASRGAGPPPG
uniref:hypothetical protein n=1 Tax=uncultured Methylobacterium sp. TaxID=157278 RepID=UPI00262C3B48